MSDLDSSLEIRGRKRVLKIYERMFIGYFFYLGYSFIVLFIFVVL